MKITIRGRGSASSRVNLALKSETSAMKHKKIRALPGVAGGHDGSVAPTRIRKAK